MSKKKKLTRRGFTLTAATMATATLAGCVGGDDELYTEDDDPAPPTDHLEERGFEPEPELNPDYDHIWVNDDSVVMFTYRIYEDADEASDALDEMSNRLGEYHEVDHGDNAIWGEQSELAQVLFTHSNGLFAVYAMRESGLEVVPAPDIAHANAEEYSDHLEAEYE